MSMELAKQAIAEKGVVAFFRMERDADGNYQQPHVTEITDTHVIGYREPEYACMDDVPKDCEWAQCYYKLNPSQFERAPFRVKHNGKKFTFGGGSSSGTYSYYFKDIVK